MFINLFFQFADREAVHVLIPLEVSLGFPDPLEKFFPKFYESLPFLHQVVDLSSPYSWVIHDILPVSLQLTDLHKNGRMWLWAPFVRDTLLSLTVLSKHKRDYYTPYIEFSGEPNTKHWIFPTVLRIKRLSTWVQNSLRDKLDTPDASIKRWIQDM